MSPRHVHVLTAVSLGLAWALAAVPIPAAGGEPGSPAWIAQLSTIEQDYGRGVAVDMPGNVYVAGYTFGNLAGTNQGLLDGFLARYSAAGGLTWKTQFGTTIHDFVYGIAVDVSGNAFVTGCSRPMLSSNNNAFLAKFSATGEQLWMTQVGPSDRDIANSVAVDTSGNAYVAITYYPSGTASPGADAFLVKYSAAGGLVWETRLGSGSQIEARAVAVDQAGNPYITGYTYGNLGGPNQGSADAFLAKYSPTTGGQIWATQLGTTGRDYADGVSVDGSGNAYVTGVTGGSLGGPNQGSYDAFLAKYSSITGGLQWKTQFGTTGYDYANGVSVDGSGNAYVAGFTDGGLDTTSPNQGYYDAFLAKFSANGGVLGTTQLGTSGDDRAYGVAVSGSGDAYIAGYTEGFPGLPGLWPPEVFLAKFTNPTPQTELIFGKKNGAALRWNVANGLNNGPQDRTGQHVNLDGTTDGVRLQDGELHMSVGQKGGVWYGAEVDTAPGELGYGRYIIVVSGTAMLLDPDTVVGMFTYDHAFSGVKNEIDIELSSWNGAHGDINALHGAYVPNDAGQANPDKIQELFKLDSATVAANGGLTTHVLDWGPDKMACRSYYGGAETGTPAASWSLRSNDWRLTTPDGFPTPGGTFGLNFWLYDPDADPATPREVVFKSFNFTSRADLRNADFDLGNLGVWTPDGPGLAEVISDPADSSNYVCRLTTGSPVAISQSVDTLDSAFRVEFDYQFLTTTGQLEVWLGTELLGTLDAPLVLANGLDRYSIAVNDPSLFGLQAASLTLAFNGPTTSQILLDNVLVESEPVPEPATLALLALGGLSVMGRVMRRRKWPD